MQLETTCSNARSQLNAPSHTCNCFAIFIYTKYHIDISKLKTITFGIYLETNKVQLKYLFKYCIIIEIAKLD